MTDHRLTFADVRDALARRGITGSDAETAFASWQRNRTSPDGCRVQAVLTAEGMIQGCWWDRHWRCAHPESGEASS